MDRALTKLREKQLEFIVLNDALEPGAGFETETNKVTIIGKSGEPNPLPVASKHDVAETLLDRVESLL